MIFRKIDDKVMDTIVRFFLNPDDCIEKIYTGETSIDLCM